MKGDDFMNYYELLDEKAKLGLDNFKYELENNPLFSGLLWTELNEIIGVATEIVIETFDKENYNTEFLTSYEFDENGKLI